MRPCLNFCSCALALSLAVVSACSSKSGGDAPAVNLPPDDTSCAGPCPQSAIKHVVIVIQENHTFDSTFGRYCTAAPGSNPSCNEGPSCCEAAPPADPAGTMAALLDDNLHAGRDPDHSQACEAEEIDGGRMDKFATAACGSAQNVAYADASTVKPYWDLAASGALADRYFQPVIGASASNDMYFARAGFVFKDNDVGPKGAVGITCAADGAPGEYTDPTIGDLLDAAGVPYSYYVGGYAEMAQAVSTGACPARPEDCAFPLPLSPCVYDPNDTPFEYFPSLRGKHIKDFGALATDLSTGALPAVVFVKAVEYKSEHPGHGTKLSVGVAFATGVAAAVAQSKYRDDTLVLITYDEGGGFFDHVAPPPPSTFDNQPYGTRVPLIASGPFAKKNAVSHVTMEHSSIVKFLEWNWLAATGQLKTRDAVVANIGSLLDPSKTGLAVPVD